jgi:hypothetical protein
LNSYKTQEKFGYIRTHFNAYTANATAESSPTLAAMSDSLIHIEQFETPLGTFRTWLESSISSSFGVESNAFSLYAAHDVTLRFAEIENKWLPEGFSIESSMIWRWYIEKTKDFEEVLTIHCKLIEKEPDVYCGGSSGQYIKAYEVQSKTHHGYIGTEDGELMQYRAEHNDWMPNRFKDILSDEYSFVENVECGFRINVPKLLVGEKIYFHFLIAVDKLRLSDAIVDELDESTWLAITFQKPILDDYLNKGS